MKLTSVEMHREWKSLPARLHRRAQREFWPIDAYKITKWLIVAGALRRAHRGFSRRFFLDWRCLQPVSLVAIPRYGLLGYGVPFSKARSLSGRNFPFAGQNSGSGSHRMPLRSFAPCTFRCAYREAPLPETERRLAAGIAPTAGQQTEAAAGAAQGMEGAQFRAERASCERLPSARAS